ncbi:hypothetical protein PHMEG_00041746 [Phytophthora megakarya]|uniref:Uncharacterized protein n=1 Tax=Phytophthora megakarya TaxID=4795 RepID=A0A225UB03_9STRA|nr:hypothetical protein PHMEG_00041746 [Phytophthora megakarya]
MAKVNPTRPAISASCLLVALTELLSWSQHLSQQAATFQAQQSKEDRLPQEIVALERHHAFIEKLLDINSHLEARRSSLEDMHNKTLQCTSQAKDDQQKKRPAETTKNAPVKKRRRSKTKPLIDTWFEWYTLTPCGCESTDSSMKSDSKQIIAFMKLFLPNGYVLDKKPDNYKDQVKLIKLSKSGMKPQLTSNLTFARTIFLYLEAAPS